MKVLLYVCFILFFLYVCSSAACDNVNDFDQCLDNGGICDETISRCTCFEGQPFCRCNSQKDEFYMDENCTQRWTVVTFALVASLPGLTLAVLVGVIVYMIMLPSNKSHTGEGKTTPKTASKGQDLFPGFSFASDINGRPPPNMKPVQEDHVPMTAMPNRPYSMYTGMRDPPVGGPVQPYSNGVVRGQTVSNPYARDTPSRNPYKEHSPSADHHSDYRPHAPSHTYDDLKPNQPYAPAPLYASSEHGNLRNGFPRPQLNLRY
uniref:Zgc:158432 n=1 Tax=Cyprinus carpio TaxID=7962 RepID=A0A8C2GT20_CYPCA